VNLDRNITSKLRKSRKPLVRLTRLALVAVPLIGWAIWLRPEFAGGRVDYIIVGGQSMRPTLHGGDLIAVRPESSYRVGDIVAYRIADGVFRGRRVIHRIVGGDPVHGFILRGDNNDSDDLWQPRSVDIEGKLWLRLPAVGQPVALARTPAVLAAVAGGFVFALAMTWKPPAGGSGKVQDRSGSTT
jgi:signal peptidase I